MPEALKKADEVLQQAVLAITDLINVPSLINLDFADVRTVMTDKGIAHIGIGYAKGEEKALEAVRAAVESPLLETTIDGATHVIINISGDITLHNANEASEYVESLAGEDTFVIFGAKYDETMSDEISITVIATGIDDQQGAKVLQKPSYQQPSYQQPQIPQQPAYSSNSSIRHSSYPQQPESTVLQSSQSKYNQQSAGNASFYGTRAGGGYGQASVSSSGGQDGAGFRAVPSTGKYTTINRADFELHDPGRKPISRSSTEDSIQIPEFLIRKR